MIQIPNKAATDLKTSTEDISYGQRSLLKGQAVPQAPLPAAEATPPTTAATTAATAADNEPAARVPYRVPAHSAWFAWDKVHSIEVREVPAFFNGNDPAKTPDTYRAIRNEMVNAYRRDVHRRLTWTEAKRMLGGDAAAIMHVWDFCDRWGLINFQAPATTAAGVDAADVAPQGAAVMCGYRHSCCFSHPHVRPLFKCTLRPQPVHGLAVGALVSLGRVLHHAITSATPWWHHASSVLTGPTHQSIPASTTDMGGASGARVLALPPAPSVDAIYRFGHASASAHLSAVVAGGTTGDYKLVSRPDALQEPGAPTGDRKVCAQKKKGDIVELAWLLGEHGALAMA